jgi:hypothetical protein
MNSIFKELKNDKIKINWNKKPIRIDLFTSFLTIPTEISTDHLGSDMGWTRRVNSAHLLEIGGGIVGGVNYLDSIKYGKNLANPYNNYVNPFFLFDIMTDEGKKFFIDYYKDDIEEIQNKCLDKIESCKTIIENQNIRLDEIKSILKNI